MQGETLLAALLELAAEHDLAVRHVPPAAAGEGLSPVASGVCVLRGRPLVLLSAADPPERRQEVLARALGRYAREALDQRFLPPALRACIDQAREGS